jgi:hypothetical protein
MPASISYSCVAWGKGNSNYDHGDHADKEQHFQIRIIFFLVICPQKILFISRHAHCLLFLYLSLNMVFNFFEDLMLLVA